MTTVVIGLYVAIYVIVLLLTIYVVEHDVIVKRIRLSLATIYGARVAAKYNSN